MQAARAACRDRCHSRAAWERESCRPGDRNGAHTRHAVARGDHGGDGARAGPEHANTNRDHTRAEPLGRRDRSSPRPPYRSTPSPRIRRAPLSRRRRVRQSRRATSPLRATMSRRSRQSKRPRPSPMRPCLRPKRRQPRRSRCRQRRPRRRLPLTSRLAPLLASAPPPTCRQPPRQSTRAWHSADHRPGIAPAQARNWLDRHLGIDSSAPEAGNQDRRLHRCLACGGNVASDRRQAGRRQRTVSAVDVAAAIARAVRRRLGFPR